MVTNNSSIPRITIAEILKLEPEQSLKLPLSFQEALQPITEEHMVIILTSKNKIIRLIPTISNKIYKIGIDIENLSSEFLKEIGNLFLRLGVKALYSTGICFIEKKCVFEGYIEATEFEKIDVERLKKELSEIKGVSEIMIKILEAEH